jgi:hypothetical protein
VKRALDGAPKKSNSSMVLEKEIIPFFDWLFPTLQGFGALVTFLGVIFGLTLVSVFVAYLRCVILYGPGEGFYAIAKTIATAVASDWPNLALRRVLAMASLTIREALRNWVLVAFVIFAAALLFAGWFLDTKNDHPARLYLSFVLTATERLILILAVVLSTFSIPNDIKRKTISTVVTKPVRHGEIVLGRILGFCGINTALLLMMCLVSYLFVVRGLHHRHTLTAEDLTPVTGSAAAATELKGQTSFEAFHRHTITVHADGSGETDAKMDHTHAVRAVGDGADRRYAVGPAQGALAAKVPIYGTLQFLDRTGHPGTGISVGKEWTYRQYIEGGSLAAAVWQFKGIRAADYPAHLPLEMNLSVFRTYKGDIVSGIGGTITVRNPTSGVASEPLPFTAEEFTVYTHKIPRQLKGMSKDATLTDVELFQDLVDENGNVEISIQCSERSQYFGMAQPDVYIRGREGLFFWNFVKGYAGIWLQMIIVTCFGVVFSTFLSGPVAMFATLMTYMVGLFKDFIISVWTGVQPGGGPLESLIRLVTQKNITIELEMGPVVDRVVKGIDAVLMFFVWVAARIFPDFTNFNTSSFVAYGFNIDGNLLTEHCLITLAFVLVLSVYGYFFLRTRELAA